MTGKKLNVGCGFDIREGYVNVDMHAFHNPDVVADIAHIHQLGDGCAQEVLAQDVLEHVPAAKVLPALVEWNRLLRFGGTLHVRVPDLRQIANLLIAGATPQADIIAMLYGTQAYAGDLHTAGFTRETLTAQLAEAGFGVPAFETVHDWMVSATVRKERNVRSAAFELVNERGMSDEAFVHAVFRALLGREADDAALDHFAGTLKAGTRDRYQLIQVVATSEEAQARGTRLVTAH